MHQQTNLWHARLGRPSISRMKLVHQIDPRVSFSPDFLCIVSPLAKQQCLPFPNSHSHFVKAFHLIHSDICRPLRFNL